MATILKTDRLSNQNPSISYTAAPQYPTAVGTRDIENQSTLTSTQVSPTNYHGTRARTRIGGPLSTDGTPGALWGPSMGTSVLDLYSESSGPAVLSATAHLYVSQKTGPSGVNIDSIVSKGGLIVNNTVTPGAPGGFDLPNIDEGLALNSSGVIIRRRLYVESNQASPADSGQGLTVANIYPGALTALVKVHCRSPNGQPTQGLGPSVYVNFLNYGSITGQITTPSSTTVYATASDHRLKENVTPVESGLDIISALRPRSWKWKVNDEPGIGFIAHEVQEDAPIIAGSVTGKKDQVTRHGKLIDVDGNFKLDENGEEIEILEPSEEEAANYLDEGFTWTHTRDEPVYQAMDASYMISPLVAAVQELKAIVEQQQVKITSLEQRIVALETA